MVTSLDRKKWGSYKDRDNSFDDKADIAKFKEMFFENKSIRQYMSSRLTNTRNLDFIEKPYGDYGVDLGLKTETEPVQVVAMIEIERWSQWDDEWPSFYRSIHFLGRKNKFLEQSIKNDVPFFMVYFNFSKTKLLMVSKEDIIKYPTQEKYFKTQKKWDVVRDISPSDGHVFGNNLTERERGLFRYDDAA